MSTAWYVQAAGKVWGPYPQSRLESFVGEGRVGPDTQVAQTEQGPFVAASRHAALRGLFGPEEPEAAPQPVPAEPAAAQEKGGTERPLLVFAALKSLRAERFEAGLATHGAFVRLQPGLWLVRARLGPAGLRNALTRRLASDDALLVVEAELADAAWFNMDGDTDRTARQLWAAGE